jgi:hypothetical protein
VGSQDKEIKVVDKRMFTSDGDLKEEYRFLEDKEKPSPEPAAPESAPAPTEPPPAAVPRDHEMTPEPEHDPWSDPLSASPVSPTSGPAIDFPSTPPGMGPTFYDLVATLAETAALYLGDVPLPDGEMPENLEMARLHIDLLDILRQKTVGNLTAQERAFLEDVLYRLRVRYVQKRG